MRAATASRLVVGSACLVAPRQLLALLGAADRDDPVAAGVARVLGVRLLVQGGVETLLGCQVAGQPADRARWLGAAVDLTHAATMLPVARRWPEHRRSALVSAAAATATAALELISTGHGAARGGYWGSHGDRLLPVLRGVRPARAARAGGGR